MSRSAFRPKHYNTSDINPETKRIEQKRYRAQTGQEIHNFLKGKQDDILIGKPMKAPYWLW